MRFFVILGLIFTSAQASALESIDARPLATVDGTVVSVEDFNDQLSTLAPAQIAAQKEGDVRATTMATVVDHALLENGARKDKIAEHPYYKHLTAQYSEYLLRELYVVEQVEKRLTDERLLRAYNKRYNHGASRTEVKARHILVPGIEEAEELITKLKSGENFANLARAHSRDSLKENGGDMGWFHKGAVAPSFGTAAFALKEGNFTQKPVKTPFGWHVIKVEGKREAPAPAFTAIKEQLKAEMLDEVRREVLAELRKKAKITVDVDLLRELPIKGITGKFTPPVNKNGTYME